MTHRFIILSGCSGGGKSTLLEELQRRGYATIEEPGRRIVQAEIEQGGCALPWIDAEAFARKAVQVASDDLKIAETMRGCVFFDRGLIDAWVALRLVTHEPLPTALAQRYYGTVFLAPPWPEIYVADAERRHTFATAVAEFDRLEMAYEELGFRVILLPKESTRARADLVLSELNCSLE
jgi:predicted ATPase